MAGPSGTSIVVFGGLRWVRCQRAGAGYRVPFQPAAADGSDGGVRPYEHAGARLARRRTARIGDRHQCGWFAALEHGSEGWRQIGHGGVPCSRSASIAASTFSGVAGGSMRGHRW